MVLEMASVGEERVPVGSDKGGEGVVPGVVACIPQRLQPGLCAVSLASQQRRLPSWYCLSRLRPIGWVQV